MIDNDLTLPALPQPDPVADAVVLYGYDDGEGVRPYAVLPTGERRDLAPPPVVAPVQRLTTPGFHGATIPSALVSAEHVIGELGAADHDSPVGAPVSVSWRISIPGTVGWGEVAVCAGQAGQPLRIVAHADIAAILAYPASTQTAWFATIGPVARGETLWLSFAAWSPPGGTAPMPRLLASAYPDPIASGGTQRVTGDVGQTRPSVLAALGQPYSGDPFAPVLPFVAVATLG